MKNTLILFCLYASSALLGTNVYGDQVVYDNGAGGASGVTNFRVSDVDQPAILADDATLTATTTITGIEWTGIYFVNGSPPAMDDFTISIRDDNFGVPASGSPLATFAVGDAVNRTDTGLDAFGVDVFDYSASIDFTMNGGTKYWFSIYNDTTSDSNDNFFWGMQDDLGNAYYTIDEGDSWTFSGDRNDFRLTGAVPEPGSIVAIGGMASLISIRRRRK